MLNRDVSQGDPTHVAVADVPVKGFQVVVDRRDADDVTGELLAAPRDGLWVLTPTGTRWVPLEEIERVSVNLYSNLGWATLAWTIAGAGSTLSHGFCLVLTAPAWAGVGGVVTGVEFGKGRARASSRDALYLYQFARFPAGLPPGWHDAAKPPPPEPLVPDWPAH
jgi:hypothetical protein